MLQTEAKAQGDAPEAPTGEAPSEPERVKTELDSQPPPEGVTDSALQAVRQRAQAAERSARLTFGTIVALVGAAVGIVVLAGTISDVIAQNRLDEARAVARLLASHAEEKENTLKKWDKAMPEDQMPDPHGLPPLPIVNPDGSFSDRPEVTYQRTKDAAILAQGLSRNAQAHLEGLERARTSTSAAWRDIEAIGIRVSTILMLVFLVQILSAQHRYNSRLAAHYHAVGDALVRMKETSLKSPHDFQILVQVFFPDASFGREPKTLPKEVADLVTGLAKRN